MPLIFALSIFGNDKRITTNQSYQFRFAHHKLIDIVNCIAISIHVLIAELILIVFE